MALYKATKNLVFKSLDTGVIVGEVIDLDPDYAKQVNKDLEPSFPDVAAVLVAVDGEVIEDETPKKTTRKKKSDAETETVADDAAEK
ncbi:TPA: hypothetical protein U1B14_001566 [Streptococcus suis]|uniref:hypothetical protein n=1 Tax=Streptococcus suis TaxID=1307 RepID=UPI00209AC361|nr:hypothetical protein [Streptococcus suis]MCO8207662.1 hypothetical protein [Streptococcus suis]MCO8212015.1 hypothetical protein [Streptococcus suis]HEM3492159.1 hypothetical protein [Streptococcus suis]HEM3494450.1 hypothetical protein [Streptococcus suis]